MKQTNWIERKFPPVADNGLLPGILERLAGTPARLEEMMQGLSAATLESKQEGKWSVKEETGHFSDLEPLWYGRIIDFRESLPELRPADMSNKKTHEAEHNKSEIAALLRAFREQRQQLVQEIRDLPGNTLEHVALHPRLKTPMRIVDLAFFVAEHDDHHLARIRGIITRH